MTTTNVLLLAPLKAGSGNLSTAARIRDYFNTSECYHCLMEDVNSLHSKQQFTRLLHQNEIHAVIAIHALHSGSILTCQKFKSPELSMDIKRRLSQCREHKISVLSEKGCWCSPRDEMFPKHIPAFLGKGDHDDYYNLCKEITLKPRNRRRRHQSFDSSQMRPPVCRKRSSSQTDLLIDCQPLFAASVTKQLRLQNNEFGQDSDGFYPLIAIPYVVVCAGTDINEFSKQPASLRVMSDAICGAAYIVSFSRPLLKKVISLWPDLQRDKLCEIPQAVTTSPSKLPLSSLLEVYGVNKNAHIFTLVAGVRPVKDPLFLVNTFSAWHQDSSRAAYLVIVGPMMDKECGEEFTAVVRKSAGVIYMGGLSLSDTHAVIRDSFALVNSSISEGMSTAILEAMHLGTPVIAKDITGNRAIIENGVDGLLYKDAREFVETAKRLQRDAALYRLITENAKNKIQQRHSCHRERRAYFSLVDKMTTGGTSVQDGLKKVGSRVGENGCHFVL